MLLICRLVYTCWSRIQMSRSVCLFLLLNSLSMKFSMNLWHHLLCVRFDLMFRSGANMFQRAVYLSVKNLLSVCLSLCPSIYVSPCLSLCLSVILSFNLSVPVCHLSYLPKSIYLMFYCLSVCFSVCLFLSFYVHLLLHIFYLSLFVPITLSFYCSIYRCHSMYLSFHLYLSTVSHRSEYTPHIFVNIWLYLLMWQHWRNDTLLQCKVVRVQLV